MQEEDSPIRTTPHHRSRLALSLTAFLGGGAVLAQEILAAGWLAPLYGSGVDVWAVVLAVSLLALAVGAWLGSFTVQHVTAFARILDGLVLGAALLAVGAFVVVAADPARPPPLALMAVVVLGPPLVAFGMLSPWIVDRYAATGIGPGRAAGITYAIGTLGSALAALMTGLVLVPVHGLLLSTLVLAAALGGGALIAAIAAGDARRRALVLLALLVALLIVGARWSLRASSSGGSFGLERVHRVDGFYGRHEVLEDDVSRYLLVDGVLQTSVPRHPVAPAAPGDLLAVGNALELALWLHPEPGRALAIGLGGGAFPTRLLGAGWSVEAVEIDPLVVDLARRYFGVDGSVRIDDGRRFLNRSSASWDLIVIDVYRGEHLPSHLFTEEAFAAMARRLAPDGLLAVNLIGTREGKDVRAVVRAVRTAFAQVELYAGAAGPVLTPMTLFARQGPVEDPSSRDRVRAEGLPWPAAVDLDTMPWEDAPRLTDDRNPIVWLRRDAARAWRLLNRRRFALTENP